MKAALRLAIFVLVAVKVFAVAKYVGQTVAGTNDGNSAANCYSIAQLNAASPYSPAGDDVVHLTNQTGAFTTTLVAPTSGTSGHSITYLFDTGAKFSKGNWNQSGTNGDAAIYATGKNYLTIDLGTDGIIEATSNGTARATQLDSIGAYFLNCTHITVKNGTIQNQYVRTQGGDTNYVGGGVSFVDGGSGTSDFLVDGVTINNAGVLVNVTYRTTSNVEVKNCNLSVSGVCVTFGDAASGATLSTCSIHDNVMSTSLAWSGYAGIHKEHIHAFAFADSTQMNGLKVYNNTFSGFMGDNSTAFVFLEGYVYSPLVYDNLFLPSTNDFSGNAYVTIKGTKDAIISNNTFIGQGDGIGIGTTTFGALGIGLVIKNNVMTNVFTPVYDELQVWKTTGASYDFNDWYLGTTWYAGTGADTFAQWKTEISTQIVAGVGGDSNSSQLTPNLNGSYVPVSPSAAIGTGSNYANLSAFYTTDKNGALWLVWGGGAFNPVIVTTGGTTISGNIKFSGNFKIK